MKTPTELMHKFALKLPVILAPMGGGPGTPALAAAVCEAGGLGSLGGAYLSASELEAEIQQTKRLTKKPFAVNLFIPCPSPLPSETSFQKALSATSPYRRELGLPDPVQPLPTFENFEKQMNVILREKPALFSFTFGLLPKEFVRELKAQKIMSMGTATSLEEALQLQESGIESVVAQGYESGGHRGMFSPADSDPAIAMLDLTKVLSQKLQIPVIAAGGIMSGADIASCLRAGAQAAQMGTAFLLCPEAGVSKPYREILRDPSKDKTDLTRAFSGRWARGVSNRFMKEIGAQSDSILEWPHQNFFTRDIRKESAKKGESQFLSLWAGKKLREIREIPAAELIKKLEEEFLVSSDKF